MDSTVKPSHLLVLILIFVYFLFSLPSANTISDYTALVYKNCMNLSMNWSSDSVKLHSQTLSSFFDELTTQSSKSKFFKTIAGDENSAVSGLFQCRGDLTNNDCHNCVKTLSELSKTLCSRALGARIQLHGCYFRHKTETFNVNAFEEHTESSKHELAHKICSEERAYAYGLEFEEIRATAFAAVEKGVTAVEGGFYAEDYGTVHVEAQCEGGLEGCECGECVTVAVGVLEEQCGTSVSGQVYLEGCFVGYSYHPHGIPHHSHHRDDDGTGNTGKSVAIVLGGAAALVFGLIFLMFLKNLRNKDDF